jgi:hypothetical protein
MCNGYSPTDTSVRSGVTVMQRPWPLAKASGYILVWESVTGIISVRILRSFGSRWSPLNGRGYHNIIYDNIFHNIYILPVLCCLYLAYCCARTVYVYNTVLYITIPVRINTAVAVVYVRTRTVPVLYYTVRHGAVALKQTHNIHTYIHT